MRLILFVCLFSVVAGLTGQTRLVQSLNDNWKFHRGGVAFANRDGFKGYPEAVDKNWETVQLPHTWNATDPFDDETSYYRGISWYRKYVSFESIELGKNYFLRFEGASFRTEVYVNGALADKHSGGYTGFTVDITPYLNVGENLIAVMVDNSHNPVIAPLAIGYALYGGIYRDVWLIETSAIHFDTDYFGADALLFSTPTVTAQKANFEIKGQLSSPAGNTTAIKVEQVLKDPDGTVVWSEQKDMKAETAFVFNGMLESPLLWSPESPKLYELESRILSGDKVLDELHQKVGFRWFALDPESGFLLNGEAYTLNGTNRHQDFKGYGDALDNSFHYQDLKYIKDMGANFLRLAHYPQDPYVYRLADELGLILWSEIPNLNFINPSTELTSQSATQIKEMIFQHFNHPSVVFWGSSNEILLWGENGARESSLEDLNYGKKVRDFVFAMDSTIRISDPGRLTTLAIHGSKDYDKIGVTDIPDMVSINLYDGWYGGVFEGFGRGLDSRKSRYPHQFLFVSEYGAGSDRRVHAARPKRFDFSTEYQLLFHESYLKQINARDYLVGTAIWNQFDFSQPHTGGSINHVNQKGVQTFDRKTKDTYHFYRANWTGEPMVYLGIRDWPIRKTWTGPVSHPDMPGRHWIPVFSNMEEVELFVDGKSAGTKKPNEVNLVSWNLELEAGTYYISVTGKNSSGAESQSDALQIRIIPTGLELVSGASLAINTGFHGEFHDAAGEIWIPDAEWQAGHYGHTDGKPLMVNKDIVFYSTRDRDPLYNYVLSGLSAYRLDVPEGTYEVELFFAEGEIFKEGQRIFDVLLNGSQFISKLDIFKEYGFARAFSRSKQVKVSGSEGILLEFNKIAGEPFVSAIKITKK